MTIVIGIKSNPNTEPGVDARPVPESCAGCFYGLWASKKTGITSDRCAATDPFGALFDRSKQQPETKDIVADETKCGPTRQWYRNYTAGYHPSFPGGYKKP